MGILYIFRGKAATGKTTLSTLLAEKLSIPVIRKDDIFAALKGSQQIDPGYINGCCYTILREIIQTNLDLGVHMILEIGLGDRTNANEFFNQLNFKNNTIIRFYMDCSDEEEWMKRHEERLKNPLPHQSFESCEQVMEYYKKSDINPFEDEYIIDSAYPLQTCFDEIMRIVDSIQDK